MVHAVSATYLRFEHMSPPAAGMALLLHASVALALYLVSPLKFTETEPPATPIEVTMENPNLPAAQPPPPPPEPPKPQQQAAPAQPAVPPPPPPAARGPVSTTPLGVTPPEPKTADKPTEKPAQEPPKPAQPLQETAPTPKAAEPQQQASAPPQSSLDSAGEKLPEVASPAAPLTMQDFVRVAPPPQPHEVAKTAPHPTAPPPPQPRQQLQHSPLSTTQSHDQQQQAAASPNNTFVNPAQNYARNRAMDEYQWAVIRKFSQYLPNLRDKNEGGTVTLRFTIGRDGRLIDASIANSSGVMALDKGMLDAVRAGSPYPPLPADFPGDRATFTQPITAKR